MAFQGDVAQIPLSNILQALLLNGQEGILTLELGNLKRRIRLLKKGLRLLNYNADYADLLKLILLKQKVLNESQFQNIFSTWVPGSCPPGDFLLSRRIITPELVTTHLLRQIENVLLEILLTPRLKYEFTAEEDASPYEIFSEDDLGQHLIFNANAILMETMRREDEWRRFRQEIPTANEIFTIAGKGLLSARDLGIPAHHLRELKSLLNGETSLERMTATTTLSAFEVYQVLFQLKQQHVIRTLELGEKKLLAEKLRRSLRTTDAMEIYRSILATDPNDRATRLQLLPLLEKTPDAQGELIEHYLHLAAGLKHTDRDQCKSYLQKVLAISTCNLRALDMLFDVLHATGNHKEAIGVARSVITAAKVGKHAPEATDLLYKIINFYPQETFLFHELAEIHLAANNVGAALDALRSAADVYESRKEYTRLRKTYEKILRLKPDEATPLKRIIGLERKMKRTAGRAFRFAVVNILLAFVVGGVIFLGVNEFHSRLLWAHVLKDVQVHKKFERFDRAKETLEDFERAFPYSTCMRSVQELLKEVNRLLIVKQEELKSNQEKRRLWAEAELAKARLAIKDNDYIKAHTILSALSLEGLRPEQASDINAVAGQLKKYFQEADDLLKVAELAEKSQDFAQSHQLRRQILSQFPYSRAARDLLIPVQVETLPPGADLIIDGRLIGQTPVVMRLPTGKLPSILVSKKGYASIHLNRDPLGGVYFNPTDSHRLLVPLEKSVEWKFDARASVEGSAVVSGENVCFGTRNGDILCLKQDTSEVVWTFTIPGNMDFAGGIGLWNGIVYFGSYDGKVYALDAATGKLVHPAFAASPELLPIKHAASAPSQKGIVAVNCDRKLISAWNLSTGKPAWALAFTTSRVVGQPIAHQGSLYVVTTGGDLIEIHHENGEIRNKFATGAEILARGRIARERYFVGTAQGKLLAVDLKDGRLAWSHDCGDKIVSPPTVDSEWVIVPGAKGKLHCLSTDGTFKWSSELTDSIQPETDGVIFRNHFFIGTKKGVILAIDIWTGRPVWQFTTVGYSEKEPRGVLANGVVSKGRFFLGCEDHFFYCFTLD